MTLHGRLRVPGGGGEARNAVATVRLLDVSRADAAAVTVAEVVLPLEADRHTEEEVTFDLETPVLDSRASYALAAHVDMNHSGDVTEGDYITTRHIEVTAGDTQRSFDLPLQRV